MLIVPIACQTVKGEHPVAVLALRSRPEHIRKKVVIAVPLAVVVKRDHEQVVPLKGFQQLGAVFAAADRFAQWATQSIKKSGTEQEVAHVFRLTLQHLFSQVVDNESVTTGEGFDESCDVRAI